MANPDILRVLQATAKRDLYTASEVLDSERLTALGCLGLAGSTRCNQLFESRRGEQNALFALADPESDLLERQTPYAAVCLKCPFYAQTHIRVMADPDLLSSIGVSDEAREHLAA